MREYPTDEELELFIKQMEQQELYAPKHIKEQVLSQAFPKQTAEAGPFSGRGRAPVRLLAYRLKIIAGMAAAIFMLIMIPSLDMNREYGTAMEDNFREGQRMEFEWEDETSGVNVNYRINESTQEVNRRIDGWFEQFCNIFNRKNGGNLYEN